METTDENRRFPRVALKTACWMELPSQTTYLRVHDLSEQGMSFTSPVPLSPMVLDNSGALALSLQLPGGKLVDVSARLTWREHRRDEHPRFGVQFVEFSRGQDELLEALR